MSVGGDAPALEALFKAGDLTSVIARGEGDSPWRLAALALIGRTDDALAGLSRLDGAEARFHEGVALWMAGDEPAARAALVRADTPHAHRLRALIDKPRVRVLSWLPPSGGPHVLRAGGLLDSKFEVTNIGWGAGDRRHRPGVGLAGYIDPAVPPDFIMCEMVEWHQPPPDLALAPCPTIGHTADFDLHLQGMWRWLQAFDELVVTDHTERADLRRVTRRPVTTYPAVFGRPATLPVPRRGPRDIDLLLTGTLISPTHPDKTALTRALMGIEGMRVLGVNGFLDEGRYHEALSRARMVFAYCRHTGAMVTRGIEAACMGCVTLVGEGSALALALGDGHGLVIHPNSPEGLVSAIRAVMADPAPYEARAWRAVPMIRSALAPDVVASRHLRFCAVLATRPRPPRASSGIPLAPLVDKRVAFWKGWLPGGGDPAAIRAVSRAVDGHGLAALASAAKDRELAALASAAKDRELAALASAAKDRELAALASAAKDRELAAGPSWSSASALNEMARDRLLDVATRARRTPWALGGELGDEVDARRREALALLRDGLARFPEALAPRFNGLRAAIHHGDEADRVRARSLIAQTLARGPGGWSLDPLDDVMPYDWGGPHFNARRYLDLAMTVIGTAIGGEVVEAERQAARAGLERTLLASICHHEALSTGDVTAARRAVALDPGYDWYRLDLARRLAVGDAAARSEAVALLVTLADAGAVVVEAVAILERLAAEGIVAPELDRLTALAARYQDAFIDGEDADIRRAAPRHAAGRLGPDGSPGAFLHDRRPASAALDTVALSVVMVDPASRQQRAVAACLRAQAPPNDPPWWEAVVADPHGWPTPETVALADVALGTGGLDIVPHFGWAANAGLIAARGRVVLITDGAPPSAPSLFATIVAAFAAADTRPLALSDDLGRVVALAAPRGDWLGWGGLDEHEALARPTDALGAVVERVRRLGGAWRVLSLSAATGATAPAWCLDAGRRLLWPDLENARQPARLNPVIDALATRWGLANGGLALARRARLAPGVRWEAGWLVVPATLPDGHILDVQATGVPPGACALAMTARLIADTPVEDDWLAMVIEVVDGAGRGVARAAVTVGMLRAGMLRAGMLTGGRVTLAIVAADGGTIDIRLAHFGVGRIEIEALDLKPGRDDGISGDKGTRDEGAGDD